MNFKNSLIREREPSLGADPGETVARVEGEIEKNQDADVPEQESRIEQAETRIHHAETRIDHAEIRIEEAETLIEQVAAQTEQVGPQTEQAATQTQEAKTRTDQANARTKQAEMWTHQANTRTDEANTRTERANTRTEQAEARNVQAILASEIRYRRLFETAQDGILILDAETSQVVDANPFMKDLLGYPQEEFLGRKLGEIRPFKGTSDSEMAFADLQLKDAGLHECLSLERKDGRRVEVEVISNPCLVDNKRLIQCNIRDITGRKLVEIASKRLAAIIESSNDAIIGKNLHSIITSWNTGAEKIFGYTASEMIGTSILRLIPDDRQNEENVILGKIKRGENVEHFETRRRAKDGSLLDVSITASPIKDANGTVIGASKVARDITELKRVQSAKEQAESADRMKSVFLANMSHELRTPLNGIIGFSEFLIDGKTGALTDKQTEYVTDILSSGRHLLQLINDVLDLAKVEAGKMELHPESFSVAKAVEEVNSIIGPMAQWKSIEVSSTVEPASDEVTLDRQKLKQVLFNLLSNAVKFTENGGTVKLTVDLYDKMRLRLRVQDNGIGIKPEDLDMLFIEFRQLDSGLARRHQGTGLGLALTKKIVEFQKGTIAVRSKPGKGSTFTVILPRVSEKRTA